MGGTFRNNNGVIESLGGEFIIEKAFDSTSENALSNKVITANKDNFMPQSSNNWVIQNGGEHDDVLDVSLTNPTDERNRPHRVIQHSSSGVAITNMPSDFPANTGFVGIREVHMFDRNNILVDLYQTNSSGIHYLNKYNGSTWIGWVKQDLNSKLTNAYRDNSNLKQGIIFDANNDNSFFTFRPVLSNNIIQITKNDTDPLLNIFSNGVVEVPGTLKAAISEFTGNIAQTSGKFEQQYNGKTKVSLISNAEGGNISIFPPDSVSTTAHWEIDAYNGHLRLFYIDTSGVKSVFTIPNNASSVNLNNLLKTTGGTMTGRLITQDGINDTAGWMDWYYNGTQRFSIHANNDSVYTYIENRVGHLDFVSPMNFEFRTDRDGLYVANNEWNAGKGIWAGSYQQFSSKLIKENIEDLTEEDGKKVLDLRPVSFDFKKSFGGEKNNIGLIAEETLDVIPEIVNVPDDYDESEFDESNGLRNKILSIDYVKLTPYLVKLCQNQQKQIDELTKRIEALENKL